MAVNGHRRHIEMVAGLFQGVVGIVPVEEFLQPRNGAEEFHRGRSRRSDCRAGLPKARPCPLRPRCFAASRCAFACSPVPWILPRATDREQPCVGISPRRRKGFCSIGGHRRSQVEISGISFVLGVTPVLNPLGVFKEHLFLCKKGIPGKEFSFGIEGGAFSIATAPLLFTSSFF